MKQGISKRQCGVVVVKMSELLGNLQDNIDIEGRSDSLRMFVQGVGFRESNIKRGERNEQMTIDTQN